MPEPLTSLERDVLDYLIEYVRANTYQPSIREIGARFDVKSTKTVSELLQALADKGWIERDPSRSRGVRLLGLDLRADAVSVPHVDVHMSDPVLRDPIDNLTLDRRIAGSSACFLISMVGNGMRDAGIWDGDLLLVEPVPSAELEDGDLVATRDQGETVIRRHARAEAAAAPHMLGRIVAVLRRLRTDAPAGMVEDHAAEGVVAT